MQARPQPEQAATAFAGVPGAHRDDLNRRPFVLRHDLAGHRLFSLDRLARLAEFLEAAGRKDSVLHRDASTQPHQMGAWDNLGHRSGIGEVIRNCRESGAWVALHDSETDPEYRDLLHAVVRELSIAVDRDLLAEAEYVTGHIFIGSPNSVTDYHMDSETNFLVVMAGEKHFNLFDGDDESILPQQSIEDFYWGTANALRYRPELAERGVPMPLGPGDCLHVPVNFPHWVQNGPEPCIALSVLLYLPENVDRAHAFQANWLSRKAGLRPAPLQRNDHAALRRRGRLLRALSRRQPLDKRDVIASGRQRLKAPLRAIKHGLMGLRAKLFAHPRVAGNA